MLNNISANWEPDASNTGNAHSFASSSSATGHTSRSDTTSHSGYPVHTGGMNKVKAGLPRAEQHLPGVRTDAQWTTKRKKQQVKKPQRETKRKRELNKTQQEPERKRKRKQPEPLTGLEWRSFHLDPIPEIEQLAVKLTDLINTTCSVIDLAAQISKKPNLEQKLGAADAAIFLGQAAGKMIKVAETTFSMKQMPVEIGDARETFKNVCKKTSRVRTNATLAHCTAAMPNPLDVLDAPKFRGGYRKRSKEGRRKVN